MKINVGDKDYDLEFTTEEFFFDKFNTEVLLDDIYNELSPGEREKEYSPAPFFRPTNETDTTTNDIFCSIPGIVEQLRRNWPVDLLDRNYEGEVPFYYWGKDGNLHKNALEIKKKEIRKSYESNR